MQYTGTGEVFEYMFIVGLNYLDLYLEYSLGKSLSIRIS